MTENKDGCFYRIFEVLLERFQISQILSLFHNHHSILRHHRVALAQICHLRTRNISSEKHARPAGEFLQRTAVGNPAPESGQESGRYQASAQRAAIFLSNRTYYKDERAQWIKDRDVLIEIMKKELVHSDK